MEKKYEVSNFVKWLWCWFYNLKFLGLRLLFFCLFDLFLVFLILSNWLYNVYNYVYN